MKASFKVFVFSGTDVNEADQRTCFDTSPTKFALSNNTYISGPQEPLSNRPRLLLDELRVVTGDGYANLGECYKTRCPGLLCAHAPHGIVPFLLPH